MVATIRLEWRFHKEAKDKDIPKKKQAALPPSSPSGECTACGKIYCKACMKAAKIKGNKCPGCGKVLQFSTSGIRIVVNNILRGIND